MKHSADAVENKSRSSRRKVLIADPTVNGRSELVRRLRRDDFEVQLACSVREIRSLSRYGPPSFALLELRFPDGDVFDMIRELREANPEARILVHTAYCNLAVAVMAIKAGACDVLPKPVEVSFVLQLLLGKQHDGGGTGSVMPCPNAIRKEHIRSVVANCNWNVTKAAGQLAMHRRTLQRMMRAAQKIQHFPL